MGSPTLPVTEAILSSLVRLIVSHLGGGYSTIAAITITHFSSRVEDAATLQVKPLFHICDRHNFGNQTDSKRSYGSLFVPNFPSVRSLWRRSLRSPRSLMSCFYDNRCNRRETFSHLSDRCYHMEITLKNELNVVGGYS